MDCFSYYCCNIEFSQHKFCKNSVCCRRSADRVSWNNPGECIGVSRTNDSLSDRWGWRRDVPKAPSFSSTMILNYNILAYSKEDIDSCMEMMYKAYMGNLSPNISAVLVSATNDDKLKEYELLQRNYYRNKIYKVLHKEGKKFARGDYSSIDESRLQNVWNKYKDLSSDEFIRTKLNKVCKRYLREFMVIHRVRRVLRKCGQYQDLILLSSGDKCAYTYCDTDYYDRNARFYDEPLFYDSDDVRNIYNRNFDYTLVLDSDTGLPNSAAYELLKIAEEQPDRGIIQPAIKMKCEDDDTLFMHLEKMRQTINEPLANSNAAIFQQSSFFGKGMIKNSVYKENVLGTRDRLVECVPIDVLSHDTFEAALLQPLYVGTVFLEEAPCYNYVSWNIRERRWNKGELILAMYFWKTTFGKPMRWLQRRAQGNRFIETRVRTESHLDFVSGYIAHAAMRQMIMKPLLLIFVLIHIAVELKYQYLPIAIIMFIVLIFPKFATCNRHNFHFVAIETFVSVLQFTPEAIVGCVRIVRALKAVISGAETWVPQQTVEQEFRRRNPFISSFKHLWGYSLTATIGGLLVVLFYIHAFLLLFLFATVIVLPVFTAVTSLPLKVKVKPRKSRKVKDLSNGHAQGKSNISTISTFTYSKSEMSIMPRHFHLSRPATHINSKGSWSSASYYDPFSWTDSSSGTPLK